MYIVAMIMQELKAAQEKRKVELLYNEYGKKLYGFAVQQWKLNEDFAWEMVYKTLYNIADKHERYEFENEQKLQGFIFKSFVNYLRNHYRDMKRKEEHIKEITYDAAITDRYDEQAGATEKDVMKKVVENSMQENSQKLDSPIMLALRKELNKLEEWQKTLLLMRCQNFKYEDIAVYVNKPTNQLKVYYGRLIKKLTSNLNESKELSKASL